MAHVAICIPSYKPDFFEVALASALAQSYRDIEILVSDDCKTEAIKEICDFYPRVKYSRNPQRGGEFNIPRLIDIADAEYIKFLFDDDLLHPFCVQNLVEAMELTRSNGTTLAFSPRDYIDANSRFLSNANLYGVKDEMKLLPSASFIGLTAMQHLNTVGEFTTTLFRKADCYDSNGTFDLFDLDGGRCRGLTDLSAWIRLASRGPLIVHPATLSYFRQHSNSNSNASINKELILAITDCEHIMRFAERHGYIVGDQVAYAYSRLALVYRHNAAVWPELEARARQLDAEALTKGAIAS